MGGSTAGTESWDLMTEGAKYRTILREKPQIFCHENIYEKDQLLSTSQLCVTSLHKVKVSPVTPNSAKMLPNFT